MNCPNLNSKLAPMYTKTITQTFYFLGIHLSHLLLLASTISKEKKKKERKMEGGEGKTKETRLLSCSVLTKKCIQV